MGYYKALASYFQRATAQLPDLKESTWLTLAILPLALGLRLYHLDYQNLWLDETLTWADSQLPLYWLLRRSALNVHPPGSFLFMKLWTGLFGSSPAMLRLPFVLVSLMIIVLTFKLARLRLPRRAAFLAVALMALSPYQVYFAQEARMYTLVTVLTLGGVICYLRLQQQQFEGWSYRIGFILLFAAALHTHYFSLFILLTLHLQFWVKSFWRQRSPASPPKTMRIWIWLNMGIGLACVPWGLFVVLHPAVGRVQHDWRLLLALKDGVIQLRDLVIQMTVGYHVYPHDLSYAFNNVLRYPGAVDAQYFFFHRFLIFGVGVPVMLGMLARGLWFAWRQASEALVLLFIPLLLILIVMFVAQREMILSRYLMMTSPYFFLILATGVVSLKAARCRILTAGSLMLSMGLALTTYYAVPSRGADYRPIVNVIRQGYQLGDVIVTDPSFIDRSLQYYLSDDSALWEVVINTDLADTTTNYLAMHASLPRVWLVLDYRSDLFPASVPALNERWPSYEIDLDDYFPKQTPKVRVLRLQFPRESEPLTSNVGHGWE